MTPKERPTTIPVSQELLSDSAFDVEALLAAAASRGRDAVVPAAPQEVPPAPDHAVGGARECCDRCGRLTETEPFESWKGPLDICSECWSDTVMEE